MKIELEVRKRMAMDEWLLKNGWLGLFLHLLKHGVFEIAEDQEDVLEGRPPREARVGAAHFRF